MLSSRIFAVLLASSAYTFASCSRSPAPAHPSPGSTAMVIDRLSFGRNIPTGGTVSDSALNKFLDEVVTPRFPDGFAMSHGEGRWRLADGRTDREASFFIDLFHPAGTPADTTFENIAKEYIRRFNQEAVARVRFPVQQWMYWGVKPH